MHQHNVTTEQAVSVNHQRNVRIREQRTPELVAATVRENFWGGVGATAIVLAIGGAWINFGTGVQWDSVRVIAAATGAIVFGALSLLRFSLDEWRDWYARHKMEAMLIDLRMENDGLRQQLATALHDNHILSQQRAVLAARANHGGHAMEIRSSEVLHAKDILQRWAGGLPYSRDDRGSMSKGEWSTAMDLLTRAGLIEIRDRKRAIVAGNLTKALAQLDDRAELEAEDAASNFVRA